MTNTQLRHQRMQDRARQLRREAKNAEKAGRSEVALLNRIAAKELEDNVKADLAAGWGN